MKLCPSCHRTFPEDGPQFCSYDGMRLVKEESVAFDPERTMMTSGGKEDAPAQSSAPPREEEQPQPYTPAAPNVQEEVPPPQQQPAEAQQFGQRTLPPPQWRPEEGNQFQPQQPVWPPAPQQSPAPPPAWGGPVPQPQPMAGLYGAPFTPSPAGRSRALAIASLVCGVDIATFMALAFLRDRNFTRAILLGLPILAIVCAGASLFLALTKPARFGGVELAIAGLALGVAGLVYVLLRGF